MAAKPFQISAKDLGGLAVEGACERCFWIRRHRKLPYQMFPGVFGIMARAIREEAHNYVEEHEDKAPPWLQDYGARGRFSTQKMSWRVFQYSYPEIGVLLTGEPDDIWEPEGGPKAEPGTNPLLTPGAPKTIVDYKVSRAKGADDPFHPVYRVQLNGYRLVANSLPVEAGYGPVGRMCLVYFDPIDAHWRGGPGSEYGGYGIQFFFEASTVEVPVDETEVIDLMARARKIYDLPGPPEGAPKCKDCKATDGLMEVLR